MLTESQKNGKSRNLREKRITFEELLLEEHRNIFSSFSQCKVDLFYLQVFRELGSSSTNHGTNVIESLLRFFPGFDSFTLPLPTDDADILSNIYQEKSKLNSPFLRGLEQLKDKLKTLISPKQSFNDGEFVTGEGKDFFPSVRWFCLNSSLKTFINLQ